MSGSIYKTFKSLPEFYEAELNGRKPCTVRIEDAREVQHIDVIRIECVGQTVWFERCVTWQGTIGTLLGKSLTCYCWRPPVPR